MLIDKKRLIYYFIFVFIAIIAVDLFMFNNEGINGNGITSCAYDGIFVWGVYKMLIIGFFPIIMVSVYGSMHDEITRNICVVRMYSRQKLWVKEEGMLLALSGITVLFSMLVSFCISYILNCGHMAWVEYIENNGDVISCSYLYIATDVWSSDIVDKFALISNIFKAVVINSLWVFIFVTFVNIMWWIFRTKLVGVIVMLCICMPLAFIHKLGINFVYKVCGLIGLKLFESEYYQELIYSSRTVYVIFCQVFIILILHIVSRLVITKRNFI